LSIHKQLARKAGASAHVDDNHPPTVLLDDQGAKCSNPTKSIGRAEQTSSALGTENRNSSQWSERFTR